jgi:acyl carrier protein
MDTEKRELWDRLENEPERAYRAFECFLGLPSDQRTIVEAYRSHVDNPVAAKPSDTWARWSHDFAWVERANAYDDHLASLRRGAYEEVIAEEAARQAHEVEKVRGRYNELMTLGYERAVEWLENAQASDLRAQDVLTIVRLYMDAEKAFGVNEPSTEAEWTEEDERDVADIVKEIDALADNEELRDSEGDSVGDSEDTDGDHG